MINKIILLYNNMMIQLKIKKLKKILNFIGTMIIAYYKFLTKFLWIFLQINAIF